MAPMVPDGTVPGDRSDIDLGIVLTESRCQWTSRGKKRSETSMERSTMREQMTIEQIFFHVLTTFDDVVETTNWGERALFYNPGRLLSKGVYLLTVKEKDGVNDRASHVDRPGVFRLNLGITKTSYLERFHAIPARPTEGGTVDTGHDFTRIDTIMPHPVNGWMC